MVEARSVNVKNTTTTTTVKHLEELIFSRLSRLAGSEKGHSEVRNRLISEQSWMMMEEVEHWPFRERIDRLVWLPTSTRSDVSNTVRADARYCTFQHPHFILIVGAEKRGAY